MADQMQAIKRRMKSVSSTERITNAMKLVSAAKLKQATNRYDYIRRQLDKASILFRDILEQEERSPSVYLERREGITLYIVLSGSKGLCGSYNSSIMKAVSQIWEEEKGRCRFLALGTKGKEGCIRAGVDMQETEYGQMDEMVYEEISRLSQRLLKMYLEEEVTGLRLIYTSYLNSISHEVKVGSVLPLDAEGRQMEDNLSFMEYAPLDRGFFDGLAEEYITWYLYRTVAEATLCEHAARRIAMKNANDNANEMLTELTIYYNRARQAAITSEIIEIIAGSEAQKIGGRGIE